MLMADERDQVLQTCLMMQRDGLVVGTAGNVSVRDDDLIAISPSGVEYAEMRPADVVVVDLDGRRVDGVRIGFADGHAGSLPVPGLGG